MRATILFAHGSRDPLWRVPMDKVAQCMLESAPHSHVRCAFLELTLPDLSTVAAELAALGVTHIVIVPMFLGVGRHAREDMPVLVEELRVAHPQIEFQLKPSVGEQSQVIEMLAQVAMS